MIALRDWCQSKAVAHITKESTSIYWKPMSNILEEKFEIILVNAKRANNVPGHKTDKKDSAWLSKLLLSGLLKASFIPKQDITELKDLVFYKRKVVADTASEKNRTIKILEDANIKLSTVLTNVGNVVGTKTINDLISGKTEADELLQHYHTKIKASKENFKKSLEDRLTKHHQFMLKLIEQSITDKEALLATLELQINQASKAYAVVIENLQSTTGVAKDTAIKIISEMGGDMGVFVNEHCLNGWAGMSPGNNESDGKKVQKPSMKTNIYNQP
ncbi:MAG: transposase [Ferruginibacter sp.]